jgi:uncharacterized protein YjbJ (UPF0337 family)
MSDLKGQAKENVGKATGDDDFKREGQTEQAGEKVKDGVEKATDKVEDVLRKDSDRR